MNIAPICSNLKNNSHVSFVVDKGQKIYGIDQSAVKKAKIAKVRFTGLCRLRR